MGRIKEVIRKWKFSRRAPVDTFTAFYRKNRWGDDDSLSGKGSNLDATQELRAQLPGFLRGLGVHSMLDVPCGDFFWMQHVDLEGIAYTGGDIVPDLIADNNAAYARMGRDFAVIDLIEGNLPTADLVFTRDCLVHLSNAHIASALTNIKASGATWLLTTTFPDVIENADIATGQWRRINLTLPPFNLPAPAQQIDEGMAHLKGQGPGKVMGLWAVADLPDLDLGD